MPRPVDPNAYLPKFVQIADDLRTRIGEGKEFTPGGHLPSERYLASEYGGTSPQTVRRAFEILRAEGLIATERGVRALVLEREEPTVVKRGSGTRVSFRKATREDQNKHQIPEGTPLLVVSRDDQDDEVFRADSTVVEFDDDQE